MVANGTTRVLYHKIYYITNNYDGNHTKMEHFRKIQVYFSVTKTTRE